MVDAIISAVVEDLTSMMLSTIKEEVKLVTGVNDEVKKLVRNFKNIQDLLDDAEEQQLKEASVKNWLLDLKTVSYDMDDVIDEWKTWIQKLQRQLQPPPSDPISTLKQKVFSIFHCNCFALRDVGLRHVISRRIKEIHQILDDIATDKVRYQLNSTNKSDKHIERHVTTSVVETQKVKGRDVEKDQVKSMILEAKSNPHIISLVGMGGIGKTTLAKLIYNDSEIQSHFEKKIWVCVSEPFDEMRIAKAILESLDSSSRTRDLKELNNVVKEISTVLNKKRFLLVLDDVWNESRSKWEELEQSLTCGLLGSTILVTTRNERVAMVMGCKSIHKVGLLTSEECWSIISQVTLVQGDGQRLEGIGRRIAEKCKGLPLVANTVGGLLRFKKSEKEWLRVLEKKEWKGSDDLDPLKLSYYDLPLSLKQCFKYCAIFRKDSTIEKSRLIEMWMAQGYLRGKEEEDLEIVGETYFNNLIARSLLLPESDNDRWFILHDMVSDLAQTFAKDECLMIEVSNGTEFNENSLRSNANARHLTLVIEKSASFPVFVYGLNKLRSLNIQFHTSLAVDAVKDIFDHLKCLRTLDLGKCGIKEVPSSINRLVHLRWLDLSLNRNLEKLPETLYECYNLQTLTLSNCETLIELPQGIGKLINLMFLYINGCFKIKYLPKGIGNLWHLKTFQYFIIGVYENKRFCIDEMEKLNNLRGSLRISGLGNVRKIEEAKKAQLMKKKNVTELELSFDGDDVQEDEEELLEALEPPSDLETLCIEEYEGKTLFPSWLMKLNLLRVIWIIECRNCEELPPLGKLLCLEELYLMDMRVKKVGVELMGIEKEKDPSTSFLSFPKLKQLEISGFLEWEEWEDINEWLMERINNKTITVMPSLQYVNISKCPKLKTLPYCLLSPTITPELQRLYIHDDCHAHQQIQKDKLSHIPDLYVP